MSIFKKVRTEDSLIPILFGEVDHSELCKLFPEVAEQNENEIQKFLLRKTAESEESRIQLIAWNKLREMSAFPKESFATKVLGFVIEVGMKKGVDYLAVYSDNSARYYNFAGEKTIYESADNEIINQEIQRLLSLSLPIVEKIGVWNESRRTPPDCGYARINFLTPKGLYFGEALLRFWQKTL